MLASPGFAPFDVLEELLSLEGLGAGLDGLELSLEALESFDDLFVSLGGLLESPDGLLELEAPDCEELDDLLESFDDLLASLEDLLASPEGLLELPPLDELLLEDEDFVESFDDLLEPELDDSDLDDEVADLESCANAVGTPTEVSAIESASGTATSV